MTGSVRRTVFELLEAPQQRSRLGRGVDVFMVGLIVLNVAAVCAETVESLWLAYRPYFEWFEVFSVAVFTVEYAARLWVCIEHREPAGHAGALKSRLDYAITPYALIDLLAILPFYLGAWLAIDLRFLRIFRLVRLLKLARYSTALDTLAAVIYSERKALMAAFVIMCGLLVFCSSFMYLLEHEAQPDDFGSIPAAMWWAMATLTTVGYGDVVPITPLGRVFGGLVTVLGLAMYALPIGIMASGFVNEVRRHEFVVTWGMVARVPLFRELDARSIAQIAGLLRSETFRSGEVIVARGEQSDAMYFIVDGEVEVELEPHPVRLTVDEFFGELALLRETEQMGTVKAVTDCRLMVLEKGHFHHLLDTKSELRDKLDGFVKERLAALNPDGS
jgi:voltage-gated potassium channel